MPVPNLFGYNTTRRPGCLKLNNVNIAVDDRYDFGPTSSTGIWYCYNSGTTVTDNIIIVSSGSSPTILPADNTSLSDYWMSVLQYGEAGFTTSQTNFNLWTITGATNTIMNWFSVQIGNTATSGITTYLDARIQYSLPANSSARTWFDLSGNQFNSTLSPGVNINTRVYQLAPFYDGVDDYASMSGNSTIFTSNFTWQILHRYTAGTTLLYPLISSGSGATKNFNIYYSDLNTSGTSMVIETSTTTYSSTTTGTNYNGFSGQNGVQTSIRAQANIVTTIVKEGNEFRIYWDYGTLKWIVNIPTWSLNNNLPIYFMGNSNLSLFSQGALGHVNFYNRALSTDDISKNVGGLSTTGGTGWQI